jgi:hypothetical protein
MEDVWHLVGEGVRPVGKGDWKSALQGCRFGYSVGKRQTKIQPVICYTTWPLAAPTQDGLPHVGNFIKNMNAGSFLQLV